MTRKSPEPDTPAPADEPELERPRVGGSYVREEGGKLRQVEGAVPHEEPAPEPEPTNDAPDGDEQSEG